MPPIKPSKKASVTLPTKALVVHRGLPQVKNPHILECYLQGTDPGQVKNIIPLWCRSNKGWKKGALIPPEEYQIEHNFHILKPYGPFRRFRKKTA